MTKRCTRCGIDKDLAEFSVHPTGLHGRLAKCKRCYADIAAEQYAANPEASQERARRYRKAHPERVALSQRRNRLKRLYGMTLEEFDLLLAEQGGTCAVCPSIEPNGVNWHVDHCHTTGRVRGILCHPCNTALGLLDEDVDRIKRLSEYVQRYCG